LDKEFCLVARGVDQSLLKEVAKRFDQVEILRGVGSSITLYKNFDEKVVEFTQKVNLENLLSFLENESVPALLSLEPKYLSKLFNKGGRAIVLVRDPKNQRLDSEFQSLGHSLKHSVHLLIADTSTSLGKQVQKLLKIPDSILPVVRYVETPGGTLNITQYSMQDKVTQENILKFHNKVQNGLVSVHRLSQEPPENPWENYVRTLVGRNYKEVLYSPSSTVFVMFYAPWCEYSKKLLPVFEKLAYEFRNYPVTFAKLDAYNNEISEEIRGYPTFRLYKDQTIAFTDYHTEEHLKEFLQQNLELHREDL